MRERRGPTEKKRGRGKGSGQDEQKRTMSISKSKVRETEKTGQDFALVRRIHIHIHMRFGGRFPGSDCVPYLHTPHEAGRLATKPIGGCDSDVRVLLSSLLMFLFRSQMDVLEPPTTN